MVDSMESNQFLLSLPIKHAHTIQTKEQVVPEESFESQEAKEEVDSQNRYTLLVVEDSLENAGVHCKNNYRRNTGF